MNNRALPEFWKLYEMLPIELRSHARASFKLFRENPDHPSLRFKRVQGRRNVWTVRIGAHYHRAAALRSGGMLYWFWIGSHANFDKEFS